MGSASRRRASSAPLLLTFIIGIGVGFSLGYAVFAALQWDFSGKEHVAQVSAPPLEPKAPSAPVSELPEVVETPPEPFEAGPEQHLFVAIAGTALDDSTRELLVAHAPGGVVLRRENFADEAQTRTLIKEIREVALSANRRIAPIILWAWEVSGGKEVFPDGGLAAAIAACVERQDPAAARNAGKAFAERLAAIGVDAVLGPSLDVFAKGAADAGETTRIFGDSPALVTKLGIAFADGLLEGGVTPVFRHYPGLGAAKRVEGCLTIEQTEVRELAELMFPFAEAVAHKAPAVFVGHIATPALDRDHPTRPASLSPVLVQRVLRGQWAYEGVILADDLSLLAQTPERPLEALVVECIAAGCDAALVGVVNVEQMASLRQALEAAADDGGVLSPERLAVSRARLDLWATRIAAMKPETPAPVAAKPEAPAPKPQVEEVPPSADTAAAEEPHGEETSLIEKPEGEETSLIEKPEGDEPSLVEKPASKAFVPSEETPGSSRETVSGMTPKAAAEIAPSVPPPSAPVAGPPGTRAVRHLISRGETLHSIARQYNVRVEDLKAWNALKNDTIQFGRRLAIYIPDPDAAETSPPPAEVKAPAALPPAPEETSTSAALPLPEEDTDQAAEEKSLPAPDEADAGEMDAKGVAEESASPPGAATPLVSDLSADFQYHVVGRGDTLGKIAAKYRTSEAKIIELNNITHPNIIRLGTRLKVPKTP